MEFFQGQLVKNGEVFIDDVEGELEIRPTTEGATSWSGYFRLPSSQPLTLPDQYLLVLDDGRVGVILAGEIRTRRRAQVAVFVGLSPLRHATEE
jgi:hypothetical protein